ncbi:MAG: DUF362 domain-containing protein [bacterium]
MNQRIDRREFLQKSLVAGVVTVSGGVAPGLLFGEQKNRRVDIQVVTGEQYFENTLAAVDGLGGMKKFVKPGATVGLLINSVWSRPGSFTNPDVALAVLKMCLDAGVKEVSTIESTPANYWKRSALSTKFQRETEKLTRSSNTVTMKIAKGKSLKEAEVSKTLLDVDVFINIPIAKDHRGTQFTANLKNFMGACGRATCRYFHMGSGASGAYDDVKFLSQCIADVNLIRKPNLCVVDATELITTNGPAGPGEIKKPRAVVAGTDCVAVDQLCAERFLSRNDVAMIQFAHEHGIGTKELSKLNIQG